MLYQTDRQTDRHAYWKEAQCSVQYKSYSSIKGLITSRQLSVHCAPAKHPQHVPILHACLHICLAQLQVTHNSSDGWQREHCQSSMLQIAVEVAVAFINDSGFDTDREITKSRLHVKFS